MFAVYLLSILLWTATHPHSARAAQNSVNVSFPTIPESPNVVQDDFLGISIELSAFNTLWGESPQGLPHAMQNYLSNIRARMTNPLRIRIGGDSMDGSVYNSQQSRMIRLLDPNAYFNDVPVSFGPLLFDVLNAMANTVGSMQFMIGLSMRTPWVDENVVHLAADTRSKLGDRLDAMLLGNEPDLYAGHGERQGYTIQNYIPEIGDVLDDLRSSPYGDIISNTIIGGPTVCCDWALSDVLNAGLSSYPYKYYTLQHYPNNVCGGETPSSSNISYYLSHKNVVSFLNWNVDGYKLAKAQNVSIALTEYNTASCGGDPNVAPTFAATLWAIDVALEAASTYFTALYLHTREYGITYNLFQPPSADTPTLSGWHTGSTYYATLVVAEAISNKSSIVVDLNLDNSTTSSSATIAGYGIFDGGVQGKFVFINYNNYTQKSFVLPANLTHAIGVRYLAAPNVTEQQNISWAGQTVGTNGDLVGEQYTESQNCWSGCTVDVPGPGLALVFLDPSSPETDSIYVGNSTIASSVSFGARTTPIPSFRFIIPIAIYTLAFKFIL